MERLPHRITAARPDLFRQMLGYAPNIFHQRGRIPENRRINPLQNIFLFLSAVFHDDPERVVNMSGAVRFAQQFRSRYTKYFSYVHVASPLSMHIILVYCTTVFNFIQC